MGQKWDRLVFLGEFIRSFWYVIISNIHLIYVIYISKGTENPRVPSSILGLGTNKTQCFKRVSPAGRE